ncbi:NAD(P)-dependent oxidoreductase [Jatrophihabitans sp. YIM 134969]
MALLGTGTMGAGMARSMLREGLDVRAWNRTREKAEPLAADGATVADSAADAVTGADVVVLMLFDADSVLAVLADAAEAAPDAVWVQSSTTGLDGTARIAAFAAEHDLALVDAPVLGTKAPAEQGKLVVLASGDPSLRDRVAPVFDAVGARTVWVGDELGRASALKLVCNSWVAAITASTGQAVALAQGLDLDPHLFLDAIAGGAVDTPYAHVKGGAMMTRDWSVSFELDGVRKDLGLIRAAAASSGVSTTLVDALAGVFAAASDLGHGGDDMAAVVTAFERPGSGTKDA